MVSVYRQDFLMRLADFILANTETILTEWEIFARSIWPGPAANALVLRDHAADMLTAVAWDMKESQTDAEELQVQVQGPGRRCWRRAD